MKKTISDRLSLRFASLLAGALLLILLLSCPLPAQAYDGPVGTAQMLVNKGNLLSQDYRGGDLVNLGNYMRTSGSVELCRSAAEAMGRMYKDMQAAGLTKLSGASGFRSYSAQTYLYQRKINYYKAQGYGQNAASIYAAQVVAPPGSSEHQTGLALDVLAGNGDLTEAFAATAEGKWIAEHCWEYGFILRYPKERTTDTGYIYEPWHFRYVGQPHAEYIHKNKLILEDYIKQLQNDGVIGMISSRDGQAYAVYYCTDLASVDQLSGQFLSISYATPARNSYIVTTLADPSTLYDIVGHWAEENIRHLVLLDIVTGYTDHTFRPSRNISRAELVTLTARTYRLLFPGRESSPGYLPYADVKWNDYYYPSLWLCYQQSLLPSSMQISSNENFFPNKKALRSEAAEMLAPLFAALPHVPESGITFRDMLDASPELRHGVQLLADYGILYGDTQGNFNPDATITRAEISAMLDRILLYFYDDIPLPEKAAENAAGEEGGAQNREASQNK